MPLKTLLVCLTTLDQAETLMRVAVPLARRNNAHLVGLHTLEALWIYPGVAVHIPEAVHTAFSDAQRDVAEKIKAVFTEHTRIEDFPSEFRLLRTEGPSAGARMVESSRAADLVIMAREDRETDRPDQRNAQVQVIRDSGRPVIVVPTGYDGPEIGNNIVLGWSDTRESARAAHDLLLVSNEGADVTVLRVGSTEVTLADSDAIDVSGVLSRHGLHPTLEMRPPSGGSIADVLNKVAFEKGADLIVTGALGHSRAYDFVIGATTHNLLLDAKLPVLFSK